MTGQISGPNCNNEWPAFEWVDTFLVIFLYVIYYCMVIYCIVVLVNKLSLTAISELKHARDREQRDKRTGRTCNAAYETAA